MPVINMAFDVSGLRSGVDRARAMIEQLTVRVQALEDRYARAGWEATASGRAQSQAFRGIASQVRKLAAEVAGLYGAFKAFEGIKGFIQRGIDVNESLESAQLTMASIISATHDITDEQGKMLKGAQKFNAAEEMSAKMLKEMQVLALETTASFTDIADGVAAIIAPAAKAGISLEKLPRFAITAVQAMSAMGLETRQMRTEIEALLSGNISKSQDLLATNLGITKEMVQEWQKSGTLLENINKKFEAFSIAGIRAQTTWKGLKGNMGDALDQLAKYASKDLFEKLKESYAKLIDFMINTDPSKGEIGLSKNLDGLMELVKKLEAEIGDQLVKAVETLMDWISELNKPENLAQILQAWEDFKQGCIDVYNKMGEVKGAVDAVTSACVALARQVGVVVSAFNSITAWMAANPGATQLLLGAAGGAAVGKMVGGGKGMVMGALVGGGVAAGRRALTMPSRSDVLRGAINERHSEAHRQTFLNPAKGVQSPFSNDYIGAGSRKLAPIPVVPVAPKGGAGAGAGAGPRANGNLDPYKPKGKKGGGGKSDAERLAENAERYSLSLEKMRNEVEALENAMNPALTTYDRTVAKINAEKEAAIKNADVKARETVMRKQATQSQAEEMASLEKRKAELTANQKLDELQLKTLRDKAGFYKDFAELTGRTGESIDLQNRLIDQQAKEWTALGIPLDDVNERVRLMKMEISDNPWDAMILGLKSYASETGSLAKTMADQVRGAFDSMADGLTDMLMTGKMQFTDFANSVIRDLMRIMVQKAITGPIASGLSGLLGGLFSGGTSAVTGQGMSFAGTGASESAALGLMRHGHALGGAFTGLHGYANQIVTRPTLFSYGSRLTRFARGGVMGEAGPEAVMPLTRMGDGHLGVRAEGSAPVVNVVIHNTTGQKASQQTKTDNQGNKSIEVMVGDMAAQQMLKTGSALNKAARSFSGVSQQVTRR